ncbi:MAG: hypothetical protein R2752_19190 [Vicinamibacterales bacterium]
MTHLTRDELERWRDAPDESDRDRIVTHLAACASCAAAHAALVRVRPVEGGVAASAEGDLGAFVSEGYRHAPAAIAPPAFEAAPRPAPSRPVPAPRRQPWWLAPLAAAAVLVLAMTVPRLLTQPVEPPIARGGTWAALEPAGDIDVESLVFRWTAPEPAGAYLVEVFDASGTRLWSRRVDASPAAADPALVSRLVPGASYRWTVSSLDARGVAMSSSPLTVFQVAARR